VEANPELRALESLANWTGGIAILATLGVIFYGLWCGLRRPVGRTTGRVSGLLRSTLFFGIVSAGYFGLCYLLWIPLPVMLSISARILSLAVGTLLFFPGLGLIWWGRLALGQQYFVSTSLGTQLFAGHCLVTSGPYALVRHPMYLGILLTGLGGILIYRTWTMVFLALNFLGLMMRARREEQALAIEFGAQWQAYSRTVPGWFPRLGRKRGNA